MANKIIILSRISTAPQSIESQTNDLIREAERLGYDKKHHIIIESVESAIKLSEEERRLCNMLGAFSPITSTKDII